MEAAGSCGAAADSVGVLSFMFAVVPSLMLGMTDTSGPYSLQRTAVYGNIATIVQQAL